MLRDGFDVSWNERKIIFNFDRYITMHIEFFEAYFNKMNHDAGANEDLSTKLHKLRDDIISTKTTMAIILIMESYYVLLSSVITVKHKDKYINPCFQLCF